MNNPSDMQLVIAFKEVYIAKEKVKKFRSRRLTSCCGCTGADPARSEANILEADEAQADKGKRKKQLSKAKIELAAAQERLKRATLLAKKDWKRRPNAEAVARVRLVTKQKSSLMKMAALVAEDASPAAKSRRALCPHWVVYISWALVLAVYGFASFYIIRFVLTRADRAALPNVQRTEEQLIEVWLISASLGICIGYCVAEPLIAVIRFALLPYCVVKCSSSSTSQSTDTKQLAATDEEEEQLEPPNRKLQRSLGSYALRRMDDDDEGVNSKNPESQSRSQYVLEFLSDLIETIY